MKAITNAHIYTMTGKTIKNGTILWDGTKITAIKETVVKGKDIYNAEGRIVVPGFINAHSHAGLKESLLDYVAGDDSNESSFPVTPHLNTVHGVNSEDLIFNKLLNKGITSVAVAPSNNNIIGGSISVLKTLGKTVDDMIIKENIGIKAALGSESKQAAIKTRMAIMATLREMFYVTKDYINLKNDPENNNLIPYNIAAESLIPVLSKQIPLFVHANRRDDIHTALRLAREFNIKIIIVNGAEAHFAADKLIKHNVRCILSPGLKFQNRFEQQEINWHSLDLLNQAGVLAAIVPDSNALPAHELTTMAMILRQQGYSLIDVLKSVTINPAKILGIDNRVGSLEVGKDADIILYDNEPFTINARIKKIIINGEQVAIEGGDKYAIN